MCFLRPARGFGWLDPGLNGSATTDPLTRRAIPRSGSEFIT
jgi:hypothetical protein